MDKAPAYGAGDSRFESGQGQNFFYFLNDQIGSDKQKHSRLALSTIKIDTQVRLVDGQSSNITRSLFFALKRIKHFFQNQTSRSTRT